MQQQGSDAGYRMRDAKFFSFHFSFFTHPFALISFHWIQCKEAREEISVNFKKNIIPEPQDRCGNHQQEKYADEPVPL